MKPKSIIVDHDGRSVDSRRDEERTNTEARWESLQVNVQPDIQLGQLDRNTRIVSFNHDSPPMYVP